MKWIALVAICSSLSGECTKTYSDNILYDTFYDCVVNGTAKSLDILKNIDKDEFNKNKLGIRLNCKRINEDQVNQSTIPSYKVKKEI